MQQEQKHFKEQDEEIRQWERLRDEKVGGSPPWNSTRWLT